METAIDSKITFLREAYIPAISTLPADRQPVFGKMDVQQMTEHMADSFRLAYGEPLITEMYTPADQVARMQAFLLSDKPFRDNTPNPSMPDIPAPYRNSSLQAAIDELDGCVTALFQSFAQMPDQRFLNPFFGTLDYPLTIHLLHKHAWHHLRQFGINP